MSLRSQLARLPRAAQSFDQQVVLVTGANTGLGLEAARYFVQLGAAKLILGCRNVDAGTAAAADISRTTGHGDACEVWPIDLGDFASVKRFAKRAQSLEQLDVVVANAGVAKTRYSQTAGMETTIAVNVVGTFLLVLGLLPLLKRSAVEKGTAGHLAVVASDVHRWAKFNERLEPSIFQALAKDDNNYMKDRYNVSKLLEILIVRSLADRLRPKSGADPLVIVNAVNPGLCRTSLGREVTGAQKVIFGLVQLVLGRFAEEGSRAIVDAAVSGSESHGQYLSNCRVTTPSDLVIGDSAEKTQERVWNELLDVLEEIQPGVKGVVGC